MIQNIPPQDIASEMSILGAISLDSSSIEAVNTIISAEDFYRESHRLIFRAICAMYEQKTPVDFITITNRLGTMGILEQVGGAAYIATLIDFVPTSANVAYYCRIVAEKAYLRRLITSAQNVMVMAYNGQAAEEITPILEAIPKPTEKVKNEPQHIHTVLRDTVKALEARYESGGAMQGSTYGLTDLNEYTDGLHGGDLIIIAARPNMGKSSLLGNIIASTCKTGKSALLFLLETKARATIERQLASEGNLQYHNIRQGHLNGSDWSKLSTTCGKLYNWNLWIDDTSYISMREISIKAKKLKRGGGLDFVGIDYLQLMRHPKADTKDQAIGETTRRLKILAQELDVPIILLSQLNRSLENRTDKRPQLGDLRESGNIEQDADVVHFIYRPAVYCQKCKEHIDDEQHNYREHQSKAEIIIAKQREGISNVIVPVCWIGKYLRFENIEKYSNY